MIDFDESKYWYDAAAGDRVIGFIETLVTHVRGELAKKPLLLDEWMKEDIIRPAFGIKKKSNNKRRFKTIYMEVPKGNAKSTFGAAIALYLTTGDGQLGAEVYSAAGDRTQAGIIFDIAKHMVMQNDELTDTFTAYQNTIKKNGSANFYKVLSSESKTKHGYNPSGIIFDELHIQPNRELWDTLTAGMMKRDESICFAFTTAGYDTASICYEMHEKTVKINSGVIKDDSFLGVIYTVDMEKNISLEETWHEANPGLGSIITVENLAIEYGKVIATPSYESTFRRLHLNQWVGSEQTWLSDEAWMKCMGEVEITDCDTCHAGLDLASTRDTTAFVVAGKDDDGVLHVQPFIFVPEDTVLDRSERMGLKYGEWVREGVMIQTPGNVVDHKFIKATILEMAEKYAIKSIAYDRWGATQIIMDLQDEGLTMEGFGQGYASMNTPTKELEKMVLQEMVRHGGHPVMRWMCSNVMLETDPAENIKISKKKSTEKVDGMVALVMALGEMIRSEPDGDSIYDDQEARPDGLLTF